MSTWSTNWYWWRNSCSRQLWLIAHWEELLQSVSNFIFRLTISKHCRHTPRGVRGVKISEILWRVQKYLLPGRPSTHYWVKSKTIIENTKKQVEKNIIQIEFSCVFPWCLFLLNFGLMVDLEIHVFGLPKLCPIF